MADYACNNMTCQIIGSHTSECRKRNALKRNAPKPAPAEDAERSKLAERIWRAAMTAMSERLRDRLQNGPVEPNGTDAAIAAIERVLAERSSAEAELLAAAEALVKMYVANIGTPHEFISCITPAQAWELSPSQRKEHRVWKVWDDARAAIAKYREAGGR